MGIIALIFVTSISLTLTESQFFDFSTNNETCRWFQQNLKCEYTSAEIIKTASCNQNNYYYGGRTELKVINCNLTLLQFKSLPDCKFGTISILNSSLKTVSDDAFLSYNNVRNLYLDGNQLQDIEFFDSITDIKLLSLKQNLLNSISSKKFKILKKLEYLDTLAKAKGLVFNFIKYTIFAIIVPILTVAVFIIFLVVHLIVIILLFIRYRTKFGGTLSGGDLVWAIKYPPPIVEYVILIESDLTADEFYKLIYDTIEVKITTTFKKNIKILGIIDTGLGYPIIIKNSVKIEECIRELVPPPDITTDTITKEQLTTIVETISVDKLPANNKGTWEVLISKKKVVWKNGSDDPPRPLYPVVVRYSRVLTDEVHFIKALTLFGDPNNPGPDPPKPNPHKKLPNPLVLLKNIIVWLWNLIIRILKLVVNLLKQYFHFYDQVPVLTVNSDLLRKAKKNPLRVPKLNNKPHLVISDTSVTYSLTVKGIQQRVPGVTATDIYQTVLNASFTDYLKNIKASPPQTSTGALTIPDDTVLKTTTVDCTNTLKLTIFNLPVPKDLQVTNTNLKFEVDDVSKERPPINNCQEGDIYYWKYHVLLVHFPLCLVRLISQRGEIYLTSPVPDVPKIKVPQGPVITNIIYFNGQKDDKTGIGCGVTNYDDVLQLTLSVDTAIIDNRDSVQDILNGMYKYINTLDAATK